MLKAVLQHAVTCVMCKGVFQPLSDTTKDVHEVDTLSLSEFPLEVLPEELLRDQQGDQSLKDILEHVLPVSVIVCDTSVYFLKNGLLWLVTLLERLFF